MEEKILLSKKFFWQPVRNCGLLEDMIITTGPVPFLLPISFLIIIINFIVSSSWYNYLIFVYYYFYLLFLGISFFYLFEKVDTYILNEFINLEKKEKEINDSFFLYLKSYVIILIYEKNYQMMI